MAYSSVERAIERFRNGQFVIIVDNEGRENEGDLAIPAESITADAVAFMARQASGLICVAMAGSEIDRLDLPNMVPPAANGTRYGTAFTVSVEAREGVTTGISAADRARTIRVLADPESTERDLVQPGHIFPLRASDGGVLSRQGQTEASVDLARYAGRRPAAVICEIMNDDGTMARMPELRDFSQRHDIPIVSIDDLIAYRRLHSLPPPVGTAVRPSVIRLTGVDLPTRHGDFHIVAYRASGQTRYQEPHLALICGDLHHDGPVLCRIHSECLTGDVFGSDRCDCGDQLEKSMAQISKEGRGVVLYMRQEGRGIGLLNKLRAYQLQDQGMDTVEANQQLGFPADARDYRDAAGMLLDLGVQSVALLTNNPAKVRGLEDHGVMVADRIPLRVAPGPANIKYLHTKQRRLGHVLNLAGE